MRKCFILWFFTWLCVHHVLHHGLALADFHKLENEDPKVSKYQLVTQKQQGKYSTENVNMHSEDRDENLKAKYHTISAENAQRGKGTYGGANVVHRNPNEKSSASVLESPFGFISTTNVCICLSLLLFLPHLIA